MRATSRRRSRAINANFKDGIVIGFNPPPIQGISVTGGFEFFLQDRSGGSLERPVGGDQQGGAGGQPAARAARRVRPPSRTAVPQYRIDVDRDKARALGIPINTIFETMQSSFGSLYVNDFSLFGRTYRVSLSSEADFRETPDDLRHVFVRSDTGAMVPLNELVTFTRILGPDTVDRFNIFPAAKILGSPAPGYSSGQAIAAMQEVVAKTLPQRLHHRLDRLGLPGAGDRGHGLAGLRLRPGHGVPDPGRAVRALVAAAGRAHRRALRRAGRAAGDLAARPRQRRLLPDRPGDADRPGRQERHPDRRVRLAAPSRRGVSVYDAAIEAARLRFRPIIMTSLAFILGVLPLAISTGAGSASRHSIGTGVIGGMLAATFVAILFVPLFFRLLTRSRAGRATDAKAEGRRSGGMISRAAGTDVRLTT